MTGRNPKIDRNLAVFSGLSHDESVLPPPPAPLTIRQNGQMEENRAFPILESKDRLCLPPFPDNQ